MNIEHIALNVAEPGGMAKWYCEHLGMRVALENGAAWFVADGSGKVVLELYCNPPDAVPDYEAMNPLVLHVAFASADVAADRARLVAAGATPEGDIRQTPAGDTFCMVRDPWGLTVQLVRRVRPFV
ncbi:MAG: VOC family protein [Pirellulales bacterium]|nr:VOC family protein [Pirellulales bacterium]